MHKGTVWMLVVIVVGCGLARGQDKKHEDWTAVEGLVPDTMLLVQSGRHITPEACRILSADDTTLTCQRQRDPEANWDKSSDARLVFPRSAVRNVWVWERAPNRHILLWIGIGITAGLEIAALVTGGPQAGFFAGMLLAGAWAGAIASPFPIYSPYPPPPSGPRMRKRLVYRMPATP